MSASPLTRSLVLRGVVWDSGEYDPCTSRHQDGSNHGTACCGVIGAEIDGDMTVGAAANCKLLPVKWESSGSSLFISDSKLLTVLRYMVG